MSMSTHIIGFKPPDEKWKQMKQVWESCEKANIEQPKEVLEYFNYKTPDESGVEVKIDNIAEEWSDESRSGYQVQLDKLPKDIKVIRFYNSW